MSNNQIAPIDEVRRTLKSPAFIENLKDALPKHIGVDKFIRVALSSIQMTPKLLECDRRSLFGACMTAAQLGLLTDGFLGEAYLIPYKGQVQFQPGYRGLMKLVKQSGEARINSVNVVYDNDKFEYELGDNEFIRHVPTRGERGKLMCVYAIAEFKDGSKQRVVLTHDDVMQIKKSSQAAGSNFSPWKSHESEMWKKSAVKRLCKILPLNTELHQAVAISDQADIGKTANIIDSSIVVDEDGVVVEKTEPQNPPSLEDIVGVPVQEYDEKAIQKEIEEKNKKQLAEAA